MKRFLVAAGLTAGIFVAASGMALLPLWAVFGLLACLTFAIFYGIVFEDL